MSPEEYDLIPWCLNKGRTAQDLLRRAAAIQATSTDGSRARGALVTAFDIAGTSHDPAEWPFIQHTALWMRSAIERIRDMAAELRSRDGAIAGRDARITALEAAAVAGLQREEVARAAAAADVARLEALAATLREQVDAARSDAADARADAHAARLERDAALSRAQAWEASASAANRSMDIMRIALRIPDGRPLALPGGEP